ncbi:ABC transporter substrate-binding protein [Nesterenkonia flava]|uniref:ABC transporter substrate-binding protein n=1 Tax=Nesterenkonia flava TaxID=469799 RepID=A0ABU1FPK9_9MICC|nr:ABC transporter substrate-binding protein [Nesterenkonia flava]MDR5710575.1 ABC transporter substrate-binding protein [Nesterenkonia flava]
MSTTTTSTHSGGPRIRGLHWTGALSIAALTLSSCGGGGAATADDSGPERVFVAPTGTTNMLNPQFIQSPAVTLVGQSMLEPLVRITDDYEVVPWLARDWSISADGLEVTLHLEEGITWHDGEPFTAEDVKFNIDELFALDTLGAEFIDVIAEVDAVDDHTVHLTMHEPYGALLEALALQYILPKHIYEGTEYLQNPANMEPVGTGPFIFDLHEDGDRIEVVRNEDYWKGDVQVDRVIFTNTTDANARDMALLAGDIDRVGSFGRTRLNEIENQPTLQTTIRGNLPQQVMFNFNADREELSDPAVRQLIYAAIDKEVLTETALPGTSHLPHSVFPPAMDWASHPDVDLLELFPRDVDAINTALDEAGYPRQDDGYRFTLDIFYLSVLADAHNAAEVMQSSLDDVGIRLNLQGYDPNVYTDLVYHQRDFDLAIQITTASSDPSLGLALWYTCNEENIAARNPSGVCDEALDTAAREALLSFDEQERAAHLHAFEERAAEIMISAPLAHLDQVTVYNTARWQGHDFADGLVGGDWLDVVPTDN